jgi:ComEC/Rec2-related protein
LNRKTNAHPVSFAATPQEGNFVTSLKTKFKLQTLSNSNIFLCIVIFLTLTNCFLSLQNLNYQNKLSNNINREFTSEVKIIGQQKQQFGKKYEAKTEIGNIYIESQKEYKLGYTYYIKGDLQSFELDKNTNDEKVDFDSYYISAGKVGRIKNPSFVKEIGDCDLECMTIQKVASFRSGMGYHYDQMICKNLNWISSFFGNNCIEPLAWANGLVIGNGDLFDKETKDNIKKLGLTHLIVVSGTQVSLIFAVLESLLVSLNLNRKSRWILSILGIGLLVLVVGLQAPVLRSTFSILATTIGLIFFGRRLNPFRALSYSAILLLWINPFFIISYSFWLSCVATFGLIMSMQFSKEIKALPEVEFLNSFKDIVLATFGTFLYTLPLIVNLSGGSSPMALISNIIVLPVANIITILDILGFVPLIGELFLIISTTMQNVLIVVLKDLVPFAGVVKLTGFGVFEIGAYWLVLTLLVWLISKLTSMKNISTKY